MQDTLAFCVSHIPSNFVTIGHIPLIIEFLCVVAAGHNACVACARQRTIDYRCRPRTSILHLPDDTIIDFRWPFFFYRSALLDNHFGPLLSTTHLLQTMPSWHPLPLRTVSSLVLAFISLLPFFLVQDLHLIFCLYFLIFAKVSSATCLSNVFLSRLLPFLPCSFPTKAVNADLTPEDPRAFFGVSFLPL